jgi:hypothetical protein
MTTQNQFDADLKYAIQLQHSENMSFMALNALSTGRMEQVKAFEADCQIVLSATTANELQRTEYNDQNQARRFQEYNDHNLARRLANPPHPPLAPLSPLQDILISPDLQFARTPTQPKEALSKSSLKSTGGSELAARFNQLSLAVETCASASNLSANTAIIFKHSLDSHQPREILSEELNLKSTGEEVLSIHYKPMDNMLMPRQSEKDILADRKEEEDKLLRLFPLQGIKKDCEVCRESVERYSVFPCSHIYCSSCLAKLFQSAIIDRSLMPIKCCRVEIDQNLAGLVLITAEYKNFGKFCTR